MTELNNYVSVGSVMRSDDKSIPQSGGRRANVQLCAPLGHRLFNIWLVGWLAQLAERRSLAGELTLF